MSRVQQFRKKPVIISAIQWTGDNAHDIRDFAGGRFRDVVADQRIGPGVTAEVYDELHDTWIGVKTGQWVLRGVKGEFYPCDADVLVETYEWVDNAV